MIRLQMEFELFSITIQYVVEDISKIIDLFLQLKKLNYLRVFSCILCSSTLTNLVALHSQSPFCLLCI